MDETPFTIDPNFLFAKIGRLVVENDLLRSQLAAQENQEAATDPPEE